jgi:NAD(P)-dependent dehydrogenase (short-subunit alcohol dehydrogenase family)
MMAATLEKFKDTIVENIPFKRIGNPEDIAGVVLFLSSKAANYVTGATIPVDGGILINASL